MRWSWKRAAVIGFVLSRTGTDNFLCSDHHALPQVQVILSEKPDSRISHMRTFLLRLQCRYIQPRCDRTIVMKNDRQEKHPEHPRSRNLEDVAKERESLSLQLWRRRVRQRHKPQRAKTKISHYTCRSFELDEKRHDSWCKIMALTKCALCNTRV